MGNDKLENTLIHNRAMKGNGFDTENFQSKGSQKTTLRNAQ